MKDDTERKLNSKDIDLKSKYKNLLKFSPDFREYGRIENDKIKNIPGAGFGLALTKRLVNLHGGEIWFESKLGEGTIFYFTISKTNKYA